MFHPLTLRDQISQWLYSIDPTITNLTHMATIRLLDTIVMQICGTAKADTLDWFTIEEMFCMAAACLSIVRKLFGHKNIDSFLRKMVHQIAHKPCNLSKLKREILNHVDLNN